MGKGRYQLLKTIQATSSLKKSAAKLGLSEKTVHNYIRRIEQRLEKKVIHSYKGGKKGGGSTELTPLGLNLIKEFEKVRKNIERR